MVVFLIATLVAPVTVSAKPYGQCPSCKQGCMNFVYDTKLSEMAACFEYKYELVYTPPYKDPVLRRVKYKYHYNTALFRCNHCGFEEYGRIKIIDSRTVL